VPPIASADPAAEDREPPASSKIEPPSTSDQNLKQTNPKG
jgi:hypothetical protein